MSILPDVNRSFQVEVGMMDKDKVEILLLLVRNIDVFAWSPYEVPRVDPEFIVHQLNVDSLFPPQEAKAEGQLKSMSRLSSKR